MTEARENASDTFAIGLRLASDWLSDASYVCADHVAKKSKAIAIQDSSISTHINFF